jgi:hypothetical protein
MQGEIGYAPFSIRADSNRPARVVQDTEGKLWLLYYDTEGNLRRVQLFPIIFPQELGDLKSQIPTIDFIQLLRISIQGSGIAVPIDIQSHYNENVAILPSAARTASGITSDINVEKFIAAEVCVDVTAVSGTSPTLDVYLEGKDQLSGKYKTIWSQTGINAVGTYWSPTISTLAFKYIRLRWVIGGTSPSFTFSCGMEGKT